MSSRTNKQGSSFHWRYCVGLAIVAMAVSAVADQIRERVQIESISAYLYFHEDGTFGDVDIAAGSSALRNTIIGEGDAEKPSSTTLVVVTVRGCTSCSDVYELEFSAVAAGRELSDERVNLSPYFSSKQRTKIPFVLRGTGCEVIQIQAAVVGPDKQRSESNATVPFACGE